MSLDVTIKYKSKKLVSGKQAACGSNVRFSDEDYYDTEWSANITHNMGCMADAIPVSYKIVDEDGREETYSNTLYAAVWRPEEYGIANTSIVGQALDSGIAYMVTHREELEQYNPRNGWGSYESFLRWLIEYKFQCDANPDCEIEVSR